VPFDPNSNPEVLIIMGTSLKGFGLQKIVKDFAKQIHSRKDNKGRVIFINRTKPAESA
jgi:NAD-dependent histone deacetylase SIR2